MKYFYILVLLRRYFSSINNFVKSVIFIYREPVDIDSSAGTYGYMMIEAYRNFMENIGMSHHDPSCDFTLSDFKGGMFGHAWDLTADKCNGTHNHLPFSGEIVYKHSFTSPVETPCTLVVYSCFDNTVQIDSTDGVVLDYTP